MEQLKMLLLLLLHAGLWLTDTSENFQCDNDFTLTISCSVDLTSAHDGLHWLNFDKMYSDEMYKCNLSNTGGGRGSCSVAMERSCNFVDFDTYKITLCGNASDGAKTCHMLDDRYLPKEHIKPNAPCCLAVSHNASRHHFMWKNTYEKCRLTVLKDNLEYQLRFYDGRDKGGLRFHYTDKTDYSVDDCDLEGNTEYTTRVRSKPSETHFKGQWSDWSQEVRWRTDSVTDSPPDGFLSKQGKKIFLALGVTATLALILGCALLKKRRRDEFVPTPEPYFQSLYANCHGDFKSWADTKRNMTMTLQPEDTLQVDSHVEETPARHDEMTYENVPNQPARLAARGAGSVPPCYCPEYCTMSDLEKSAQVSGN
ncbi:interleukin-21 receptor [Syngnathus typhle]